MSGTGCFKGAAALAHEQIGITTTLDNLTLSAPTRSVWRAVSFRPSTRSAANEKQKQHDGWI